LERCDEEEAKKKKSWRGVQPPFAPMREEKKRGKRMSRPSTVTTETLKKEKPQLIPPQKKITGHGSPSSGTERKKVVQLKNRC